MLRLIGRRATPAICTARATERRSNMAADTGVFARCGFGILAAACLAAPSVAAGQAAASQDLLDCRAIGSDKDRLECYDRALDEQYGVDEALQEQRAQYRRERFGLPVDDSGNQLTELEANVAGVEADMRSGQTTIALDNGQQWRLTSSGGLRATFKPGMAVVISESGTGGYRIRIPEKTGFKGVIRVR